MPSPPSTEPEGARSSMESLIQSEESTSSSDSPEDQEPAEGTMSAHMEERNSEFRHMAMTGEGITEDWPPPGTPTWSQWLEVSIFSHACMKPVSNAASDKTSSKRIICKA